MALNYRRLLTGIQLVPQNSAAPSILGEIRYNSITNKLEVYDGVVDPIVTESSSSTLSNKNLLDGSTTFKNSSDNTKQLRLDLSSITTGTLRILTVPDATDTLVLVNLVQTLLNKTLTAPILTDYEDFTEIATPGSPASGFLRIYAKSDDNLYSKNSVGIETPFASSTGTFQNGVFNPPASLASFSIDNLEGIIANFKISTPHTVTVAPVLEGFWGVIDTLTINGTLIVQHHGVVRIV